MLETYKTRIFLFIGVLFAHKNCYSWRVRRNRRSMLILRLVTKKKN